MAICSEEGRWSSLLGLKDAGTPRSSTLSGSVWRAGGAGGVSLWPVGEGACVARFLPVWLLGSTLSGSVWRAGGAGGVSLWPVGEGAWVARFLPVWLLGSTLSGSVWRAGGAGGVSLWPVGEGAWVVRFLPVWLLDMLNPSIRGRPERALGSGSDFLREAVRLVADGP